MRRQSNLEKKNIRQLVQEYDKDIRKLSVLRDTNEYGRGKCITCGKPLQYGTKEAQGGHCFSVAHCGYGETRWDERNVNLQCYYCNHPLGGNIHEYKIAIDKKWGEGTYNDLKYKSNILKKWSKDELIEKILETSAKIDKMKREKVN